MADAMSARLPMGKMPPYDASALFLKAVAFNSYYADWSGFDLKYHDPRKRQTAICGGHDINYIICFSIKAFILRSYSSFAS